MNLWLRIKNLIKAKLRRFRDSEDPRDALRKNLSRMEAYLQEIKKSSLKLGREKGKLRRRLDRLNNAVSEYEQEAQTALEIGEEKQAELALKEKYEVLKRKKKIQENIGSLEKRITSLERSKESLRNRIEIFRTKEAELDALRSASEAELRIQEITAGMSEDVFSDINDAVHESEKKLEEIQAKVKATRELVEQEGYKSLPENEEKIEDMDGDLGENQMEEELERLKKSIENKN